MNVFTGGLGCGRTGGSTGTSGRPGSCAFLRLGTSATRSPRSNATISAGRRLRCSSPYPHVAAQPPEQRRVHVVEQRPPFGLLEPPVEVGDRKHRMQHVPAPDPAARRTSARGAARRRALGAATREMEAAAASLRASGLTPRANGETLTGHGHPRRARHRSARVPDVTGPGAARRRPAAPARAAHGPHRRDARRRASATWRSAWARPTSIAVGSGTVNIGGAPAARARRLDGPRRHDRRGLPDRADRLTAAHGLPPSRTTWCAAAERVISSEPVARKSWFWRPRPSSARTKPSCVSACRWSSG